LQDYSNALQDGKQCTSVNPSFSKGFLRIGLAARQLGLIDEAAEAFHKGLQLEPNS
jgi:tetratricopeptide (TPR) repeat protein